MNRLVKPLAVLAGIVVSFFVVNRVAHADTPNVNTFDGQMFTFSEKFDNAVYAMVKRALPHLPPQLAFNIVMFAFWCESGIHAQAHVNPKEGGGYKFGLHDYDSITANTWGGGLFGLIRKYYKTFKTDNISFEDWLKSDELEQLPVAEKWLLASKDGIKSPQDIRTYGFASGFLNKPKDAILYKGNNSYTVHQYLDTNKDGAITKGEFEKISIDKWNKIVDNVKASGKPYRSKYGAN